MVEDTEPTPPPMGPERVAELIEAAEVQLVDVRTPEEHRAGRIAGALHVPLDELPAASERLDRDRPVVFYCRVGERSNVAAEAFRASGWHAASMDGGLEAWAAQGLPLEPEDAEVAPHSSIPND